MYLNHPVLEKYLPDVTAPTFQSAATSTDGAKVILTYDGALNATTAAASDFAVTTGGSANTVTGVTINGSTVELTLTTAVTNGQAVTVAYTDPTVGNDANAVQDAAGNDAVTLASTSVTNNVPAPPVITDAGGTLAFEIGQSAKVIDASLTITDPDDTNIESATVSITGGYVSTEDVLAFANANGITGSWNSTNGVLTLSGSATKANYETALESITYQNTNVTDPNTTNRTITWVVNDGDASSTGVTSTVSVSTNNAPVFGTGSTQVSVFAYPNLNGTDTTPGSANENANLASIVQKIINDGGKYTLDTSITDFAATDFSTKLNASGFFFMTDMEGQDPADTAFFPTTAQTTIRDWVSSGGVMMMTGTAGDRDTTFLNSIFGWDLTTQGGTSWSLNTTNATGTPFAGGPASLNAPSATDAIGKGTVANFKPIYGADANATVAAITYGSGTVIYLGYDYYSSGFAGTGFIDNTQYDVDVANGASNINTWVTEMIPRAMQYSANLSSAFNLTQSASALTASNTLPVSDANTTDSVSVSVTALAAQQKDSDGSNVASHGSTPDNAALLAMLSVSPTPVIGNTSTQGTLTWNFNSGTTTFDYLVAGEKLVLTYTLTANDGNGGITTKDMEFTVNGSNDIPVLASLNADAPSGNTATAIALDVGGNAAISDIDSANFDTGTLAITTTSGTADGNFSLDGTNAKAGADAGAANATLAASDKVFVGATEVGTVHATSTGQAGATLTITFNASATPALVGTLLQNLSYTSATGGTREFGVVVTDGDGGTSATSTVSLTLNANTAPVITSNGGTTTAAINVAENSTAVTTVTATDADAHTVTFSLTGGTDQAKFSVNASTGVLTFASAPDFEAPTDTGTNNTYVVDVTANDGNSGTDVQTITVTVTDVGEGGGGDPPAPPPVEPPVVPPVTTATVDGVVVSSTTTNTSTNVTDLVTGEVTTVTTQTVTTTVPIVTDTRQEENAATPQADIPLATNTGGDALLTASLPVGIGLTSAAVTGSGGNSGNSGNSNPGQTLRELLIAASEPRTEQSAFGSILGQGIDSFVPGVRDEAQVTVRTITFQVAPAQPNDSGSPTTPAAPAAPIVITGASGTGEQNPAHPDRQEALVIDVRNLPSGTVLQLDSVEFAIIIGATRVTGGNGRNFAVGDDAVQYMVLGEDDDVLRGGGGNDTIGSKGGDDQLFGDEGDDLVVGGLGDDILEGGDGDDILQGGSSDAGLWQVTRDAQGQTHLHFSASATALTETPTYSWINTYAYDINNVAFADSRDAFLHTDMDTLETIALLYQAVLGRLPDNMELNHWARQDLSSTQLAEVAYTAYTSLNNSRDLASSTETETQVRQLIEDLWGSASAEMVQIGSDYIAQGGNWAEGMLYLASHANHKMPLLDAQGQLPLMQALSLGETGWSAMAGNDQLYGGAGHDRLVGGNGNNILDGGSGIDMVVLTGNVAHDYALGLLETTPGTIDLVLKNVLTGDINILRNIEFGEIGGVIYGPQANMPSLVNGEYQMLADFVQVVGTAELQALGVPAAWLG